VKKRIASLIFAALALSLMVPAPVPAAEPIKMELLAEVPMPGDPVAAVVRPGSGEIWVSTQGGALVVVDPASLEVVGSVEDIGTGAWGLAFSPDGRKLYRTSWLANELVVVDADRRQIKRKITVGLKPAFLEVSGDGKRAWVSNFFSGELSLVDLEAGVTTRDVDVGRRPMGVAVGALGKWAYVSSGVARSLNLINLETGEVAHKREIDFAGTHNLVLSPDEVHLVAAGHPDLLLSFDPHNPGGDMQKIKVGHDPVGVAVGPEGRWAFVSNYRDATVSVVDLQAGKQVGAYPTAAGPMFLSVDPEGKRLYVCGGKGQALTVYAIGGAASGSSPAAAAPAAGD
jgi:YVTN family beta-propeller protein